MVSNTVLSVLSWVVAIRSTIARSERGQGIMEYSILLGGIALVAALTLLVTGNGLDFAGFRDRIQACIDFDNAGCA